LTGNNYILTIAIDKYKDNSFKFLNNAKFDAIRLQNLLTEKYGFEDVQESLFDSQANRANIIDALNHLSGVLTVNDKLIIYFAGHGLINPKSKKGYWLPYDATHNYINNSTIIDSIETIDAKHILIISDSCFAGTLLTQTRGIDVNKHYSKLEEKKSRWILASGREEKVSDGLPGKGSPFANSLINFLEKNKNKYFSFSELAVIVTKETGSIANQQPIWGQIDTNRIESGQMVFKIKARKGETKTGWEANFQAFCDAKETRPEWPYISKENPETKSLGIWCMDQRRFKKAKTLDPIKEQRLYDAGFIFNPTVQKFFNGFGKFLAFMHDTGYDYVPRNLRTKYKEEEAWLRLQQRTFKKNLCDPKNPKSYPLYRYEILERNGIKLDTKTIEDTWPQFKRDIIEFYKNHLRFLTIPSQSSKNKHINDLGDKVNDYMRRWKENRLDEEKVAFLAQYIDKDYGLNKHKRAFEKRIEELKIFQNGDRTKIPKQGKEDITGLGDWYAQIMSALKPDTLKSLPKWKIDRLVEEKIITKRLNK
jgi:Caspase domain